MQIDLTSSLQELASWLQSAAMVVPIAQLSFVSWIVFAASGSLDGQEFVQHR